MTTTVQQALLATQVQLDDSATPRLDAELLLCHVLDKSRAWLRTWPERALTADEQAAFAELVARRAAGEPVAYLTGRCGFWSLELKLTPATLIPRPDTETLVEWALELIPATAAWRIADLGTGSGAIALALGRERPGCRILATDASAAALAVAQENAALNGIGNVAFRQGAWYAPLAGERHELIVSNPPYIAEHDPHLAALCHEPRSALTAGPDGLDDIRLLIAGAPHHLTPDGWLLLEHGWDQGAAVRDLLQRHGYRQVQTRRDGAGHERSSGGQCP
jgi:release factor glutamine methyltransferase